MSTYENELRSIILRLIREGINELSDIIQFTEGADIRLVNKIYNEVIGTIDKTVKSDFNKLKSIARMGL